MEYYSDEEYKAHPQNWDAIQDTNGFIHISNGSGLLSFDGVKWKHKHIGETGRSTSLFIDSKGRLFANGQYDFGIIVQDSINNSLFQSIIDKSYYNEGHVAVFQTYEIDSKIIFRGIDKLFVLENETLKSFESPVGVFNGSILFNNSKVLLFSNKGLVTFFNGKYSLIEGSDFLKDDLLAFGFELYSGEYLIGTRNNLLLIFDGHKFKRFETEIDSELAENKIYHGIKLQDESIGIATLLGGIYFIDKNGKLLNKIDEQTGLKSNSVYNLFLDNESNIWAGTANGLQQINYGTKLRRLITDPDFDKIITNVYIFKKDIFVETLSGFFELKNGQVIKNNFGFSSSEIDLFSTKNQLFVLPVKGGIYSYLGSAKLNKIVDNTERFRPIKSLDESDLVTFVSDFRIITVSGSEIINESTINLDFEFTKSIIVNDRIYFLNREKGVKVYQDSTFTDFIASDSGSKVIYNTINKIEDKIFVGIDTHSGVSGLLELDESNSMLKKSSFLKDQDQELTTSQVYLIENCPSGDVWLSNDLKIKKLQKTIEGITISSSPYQMIGEGKEIYDIECDAEGVWFAGTKGLYHLPNEDWNYKINFKTNITQVLIDRDSLIYGGFGEPAKPIILPYKNNEIRISYAATSYIDPERNTYQYKLDGYDKNWSDWSLETQKDYTNLREGEYIFMVRSRNVYEVDGEIDTIPFSILPPWYRTWWAYSLYVILFTGLLYLGYKIRLNQILKVQRVRNRIADDLHDDLSGTLIGISNFAKVIDANPDKDVQNRFLGLIQKSADEAKEKISDIVWTINPEHDDWNTFLAKCRRYASDIFESQNIEYSLEMDEVIPGTLQMELRKNLWLIFKEIITNIIKHSSADYVLIRFKVINNKLSIKMKDNGKGFDLESIEKGNGIDSIKKRVRAIKGVVELESKKGQGTFWNIEVTL